MQRLSNQRAASRTLLLLAALALPAAIQPFSLSRPLPEVDQDVGQEPAAGGYSQELRDNLKPGKPRKHDTDTYVTIRESPKAYVSVPRGHRLELRCEVDASPSPRIYWVMGENPRRQVEELQHESLTDASFTTIAREVSMLVIDCVSPQDQSLIHCVGVAGDKMTISQPTVLNVEGGNDTIDCQSKLSPPVITRHRSLYFSEMGSTVVLPCEASGNPRPRVHWVDSDGQQLTDPRFSVLPSGDLVISSIRWQDMDGYKCLAKSSQGEASATTFLYPAAKSESEKRKANAL